MRMIPSLNRSLTRAVISSEYTGKFDITEDIGVNTSENPYSTEIYLGSEGVYSLISTAMTVSGSPLQRL